MILTKHCLHHVRNIDSAEIYPNSKFNLIYGENGSGKTSLLESLYVLAMGKSFRSPTINNMLQEGGSSSLVIYSEFLDGDQPYHIGLEKVKQSKATIKINHEQVQGFTATVSLLPLLLINHQAHTLIDGGPQQRRRFIDWGVFHVKPKFLLTWRNYTNALRHRNSALKNKLVKSEVVPWTEHVINYGVELDANRKQYILDVMAFFDIYTKKMLPDIYQHINYKYFSGWSAPVTFGEVLTENLHRDCLLGFTQHGPHRADIRINFKQKPVEYVLSRGQQKVLACALKLAQADYLQQCCNKSSIIMIDDFTAELDKEKQFLLKDLLLANKAQVWITGISPENLSCFDLKDKAMFHVKHGAINPVA